MNGPRRLLAPAALLAAALLAIPLLHGLSARADTPAPQPPPGQAATTQALAPPHAAALPSLAPLVDSVKSAVVNVDVTSRVERDESSGDDPFEQFFGRGRRDPRQQIRQGAGSGFVIDPRGYILTNNHVVEGAFNIRVRFDDGRTLEAEVLGRDPLTDVALIKLKAPPANLPVLKLGDSDAMRVGDWVVAIGNPFGLASSVSAGILSAKAREIGASQYDDFLQTDAAINPGNSGGPLFNLRGEVVGINTAIVSGGAGIGFAVPSNLAKAIIPQLEKNGSVTRGYIGVKLQNLTPELARALNVPQSSGALINEVTKNSPGDRAGLKSDDVVVSLDGRKVESSSSLSRQVALRAPDTSVTLGVIRNGKAQDFKVTLTSRPGDLDRVGDARGPRPGTGSKRDETNRQRIGLTLQSIDPRTAEANGLPTKGAVITEVQPGSPADAAELAPGMVVTEAGGKKIANADDLSRVLKDARPGSTVLLRVTIRLPNREENTLLRALVVPG
ncbi:MAG TPA: trypsin-like peptidase domain-containing protein [Myxococcaceae bacterium]|nr:trypsin-like peptidase domain-containing protein [Myxococcaceae bacterium]